MTRERQMKQIAINLVSEMCCTLHANAGVYSTSNTIPPPRKVKIRADGVFGCLTAHYQKISSRNIFKGFKEQAIIIIEMSPPKRYALGRTNHDSNGGYDTSKFHVNRYFNTVTAIQMSNRRQWIAEIR